MKEPHSNYQFNKVGIGFGSKSDFMSVKNETPGPSHYDMHIKQSLSYKSMKNNPKTPHGFFNKYDKYEKICYKGMEQHFYGRESKGPGAYLSQDYIHHSLSKRSQNYSIPKDNRGLLTHKVDTKPGPMNYSPD